MTDDLAPAVGLKPIKLDKPERALLRFGGRPNLPRTLEWPVDGAGFPMHHLMQIDCAALPEIDPDFPRNGTLFIFISGSYEGSSSLELGEDDGASAVLYWPEPVTRIAPRRQPRGTPPLGDSSYAREPVEVSVSTLPKGLLAVLTQPRRYSKSSTNFFAPVALEPVLFDSHPGADPVSVFEALGEGPSQTKTLKGYRPHQMLGYAHTLEDLTALDAEGYEPGSQEKGSAAFQRAEERSSLEGEDAEVLLFQLSSCEIRNFGVIVDLEFVLKFTISRAHLRSRAFEAHKVSVERHHLDGRWYHPKPVPIVYQPPLADRAPSVVLKPLVPEEIAKSSANYFCGFPQLPPDIPWPVNGRSEPLHFVLQLDCRSVPRIIEDEDRILMLPALPASGTLFLFAKADASQLIPSDVCLLYSPDQVSDLPEREPPPDLTPPRGRHYWNPHLEPRRTALDDDPSADAPDFNGACSDPRLPYEPKLPFEPTIYPSFRPPPEDTHDYEKVYQALEQTLATPLPDDPLAIESPVFVLDWLPNWYPEFLRNRAEIGPSVGSMVLCNVPQSYPWRWIEIREAAARLVYFEPEECLCDPKAFEFLWPISFKHTARDWYQRSLDHMPLDRVTSEVAQEFREWLMALDGAGRKIPKDRDRDDNASFRWQYDVRETFQRAMNRLALPSLEKTLYWLIHDSEADDLPAKIKLAGSRMLRFKRSESTSIDYPHTPKPQPNQLFAQPETEQTGRDEVLLFELTSDYGMISQWGVSRWLQVWISPEDLSANRFDKIRPEVNPNRW